MLWKIAEIIGYINWGVCGLLVLFFLPRIIMVIYSLFDKPIKYPEAKVNHKFAVVICARNEEAVISNLIKSIKSQDYAGDIDIFLAADNCTDNTAEVARTAGAIVYERNNLEKKGKAYALSFLFEKIYENHDDAGYEAFVFFDADNVASKSYFTKINAAYDSGLEIFTTFRNTKNFGVNWITKGSALMMMYDTRFAQHNKAKWGMSSLVAGTGFVASAKVLKEQGGWVHNSAMTEDLEFSVAKMFEGRKIGYCYAEYFEEQPTTMKDSANQRARWIRGSYQVYGIYGNRLWKSLFSRKYTLAQKATFFDVIEFTFPTPLLATIWFSLYYGAMLVLGLLNIFGIFSVPSAAILWQTLTSICVLIGTLLLGCFFLGVLVTIKLRKQIKATPWQKFTALYAFVLFLFSWIPISFMGANRKLKWQVIPHTHTQNIDHLDEEIEDSESVEENNEKENDKTDSNTLK